MKTAIFLSLFLMGCVSAEVVIPDGTHIKYSRTIFSQSIKDLVFEKGDLKLKMGTQSSNADAVLDVLKTLNK